MSSLHHSTLVLSSSSQARRELLKRLQIPFICCSPDVDETPLANENIIDMVKRLAIMKAEKNASLYPDAWIIGCDQVGQVDDVLLTKPLNFANAYQQLKCVSGKVVTFYTAICLLNSKTKELQLALATYDVHFKLLSDEMINNYLQKEKPFHCAGSFQAEGLGIVLIDKFHGDDYTALIGLPLIELVKMLRKTGQFII